MRLRRNTTGFTIVELLIATLVFSTILVIVTAGVIRFTKQYYKAQISNNTQNVTRNAVNQVAQAIQFGGGGATQIYSANSAIGGWCVNNHPYYYAFGRQLNGSDSLAGSTTKDALVNSSDTCPGTVFDITTQPLSTLSDPHELLGKNMRLVKFDITNNSGLYTVSMRVVYGDHDLLCYQGLDNVCHPATTVADLQNPTLRCAAGTGNEYCAVADYSATTIKRLQ